MDSTRQLKISKLILKELSIIFQRKAIDYQNKLISVTVVRITPDLGYAKVYLSIFPENNIEEIFEMVKADTYKIRFELGKIIGKQVRRIPELSFHIDDSLNYAERINELLEK